ncbi:hypothetical protein [uncultured Kordia sp.]|uniref:hypothetical protein n=1 Tax=uncultured Kordia sp. TaxID=507699 RepID=UPI00261B0DB8|nr:hypothetical protein [uncultured Kordia sp.]
MKKKDFNSRLNLNKNVISSLQKNSITGGTATIVPATTFIVVKTIKITIEHFTRPGLCVTEITNETCPDTENSICKTDCNCR